MNLKNIFLSAAEIFDAWRVVPRTLILCYSILVYKLYAWFTMLPSYKQYTCDTRLYTELLAKNIPIDKIHDMACTVSNVVSSATMTQTTFVTTIIGLSSVIFAIYTYSGRKWGGNNNNDNNTNSNNSGS